MDPCGTPHRDTAYEEEASERHQKVCGRQTKPNKDCPGDTLISE